jgi:hypothetical protein
MAEPGGSFVGTQDSKVPPDIVAAVKEFHRSSGVSSSAAKLDLIKFNAIGPNGRYIASTLTTRTEVVPPTAGSSSVFPPPQLTIAVTLRTGRARGRGSRGRFYPPYPPVAVAVAEETGQITAAAAQTLGTAAVALIQALNNATSETNPDVGGLRVVVASDLGTGVFEPVTGVEVGRVVDTMRSRRTSLKEDRVKVEGISPPP